MAKFTDHNGREWRFEFDAFLLDDIRSETGIDLADVSAGGYDKIERDAIALVKVLAVICREECDRDKITSRQFAKFVRGESLASGRAAIARAAENFFPPNEWSGIQSSLEKRKQIATLLSSGAEFTDVWDRIAPILKVIQEMPEDMRQGAMEEGQRAIVEAGGDTTDFARLVALASATGPAATQSNAAIDSPGNAQLQPAD